MKKNIIKIVLVAFLGFLGFIGYKVITKINHKKQVAENIKTIPAFSYQTLDGSVFTHKNLKPNTPVLFVYFNSECDFCQHEAQMIQENIKKLQAVQIVFISFEPQENIVKFATKYKLTTYDNVTFLVDRKATFATTFDVNSLPCLVLYNQNHQLIEKIKGQIKIEILLKKFE